VACPHIVFDPAVDEIYCDLGWKSLLIALCEILHDYLGRQPEVTPVTVEQIKSKFGKLHFYYKGGDGYCRGAVAIDLCHGYSPLNTDGKAGSEELRRYSSFNPVSDSTLMSR